VNNKKPTLPCLEELQRKATKAELDLKGAQDAASEVRKELKKEEQKKKDREYKEQWARDCEDAVKSTKLPKWAVMFIQSEAYDHGHSAGQSEVNMLTVCMIHSAEDFFSRYPS